MASRNSVAIAAGTSTARVQVPPNATISHPGGISRRAPSTNARYQSGPAPAVAWPGSEGPYSQTGLTVTNAPVRASTPKTMKKTPPPR